MFFKTRRTVTDAEKLDAVLEYLKQEMSRWQAVANSDDPNSKAAARIMYLEEQIVLTTAQRALENINPHKK